MISLSFFKGTYKIKDYISTFSADLLRASTYYYKETLDAVYMTELI